MCYDDTVLELAVSIRDFVQFKDVDHANLVSLGRQLSINDPVTKFVHEEAERLFDELPPASRSRSILDTVGIPNPAKGRECRGTKLSALRGAIHVCADHVVELVALERDAKRLKWDGESSRWTTDLWLDGERPRYPETVRYGVHEEDLFRLVSDPLAVLPIVLARHSA